TIVRCHEAESAADAAIDWDASPDDGLGSGLDDAFAERFAGLAAAASRPIDDHRATAAYRRHAVGVMAARLLRRAFPHD
ncbi:MAG TPA: hypothetical protein PLV68_18890, partial [Ilumatobacteraceae bacterium]|nr:hypothetical protein [Ilumatobacteraceae bacterium]